MCKGEEACAHPESSHVHTEVKDQVNREGAVCEQWRGIGTPVRTYLFPRNQHESHLSVEPLHLAHLRFRHSQSPTLGSNFPASLGRSHF